MSEEKRKMTFLQWIENFWYYHKWKVVAGVLLILALWAGITFYVDTLKKAEDTGDITVVSVFSGAYAPKKMNLEERLADSVKDIDGDGEVTVTCTEYYISTANSEEDRAAQAQFEQSLGKCYGDIMLFDKTSLDNYVKKDIFEPIENYVDLSNIPEEDIVKRGGVAVAVRLTNSQLLRDMDFAIDDVYVSVVFIPDDAEEKLLASRQNSKTAIAKLLEKSEEPIEENIEE